MNADVLIVGAGPTGLLLAGDLAEAGLAVTVLERRLDESNMTRAFVVHARNMEELDARDMADELAKAGTPIQALGLFGRVQIDLSRLPSRFNSVLITPQYETERVLQQRADALGARVVHGAAVTSVTQDSDSVEANVRTTDGGVTNYRASYLVGADGVNSAVRRALGLPFPGRSVVKSIMLADVRLSKPPGDVVAINAVGDAFVFVAPFGDGWYRIFAWDRHHQVDEHTPLDLAEIRDVTRRSLGTDFGMHDPRWLSRFHSDERQVPRYRVGRIFLAGDAAHCHSPAGGQGMNTGMEDAANLGWKLAAAVHGWGGEALLDSYHTERHPVGRQALRSSSALLRPALIRSRWGCTMRNVIAGAMLNIRPVADRVAWEISGIGVRYSAPRGGDPRVGTRMPDIQLAGGRLYEALRGGRFVLVGTGASSVALPAQVDAAATAQVTDELTLVRPDGYVAWIGTPAQFPAWARQYFSAGNGRVPGWPADPEPHRGPSPAPAACGQRAGALRRTACRPRQRCGRTRTGYRRHPSGA